MALLCYKAAGKLAEPTLCSRAIPKGLALPHPLRGRGIQRVGSATKGNTNVTKKVLYKKSFTFL
jgi:hypothetical protein